MPVNNISGPSAIAGQSNVYNALIPAEGPRAVGFQLDFIDFNENLIDFTYAYEQKQMTVVQSVWIDNSANDTALTLASLNPPFQTIVAPAFSQGSYPVIAAIRPKFAISTNGNCIVPVIFLNVPITSNEWATEAPGASAGTAPAVFTIPAGPAAVNPFGGSNLAGPGSFITNPLAAAESLFVDPVNVATVAAPGPNGTTVELVPGGTFVVPPGGLVKLSVIAATPGHTFSAVGFNVT